MIPDIEIYNKIDSIIQRINQIKIEPLFGNEKKKREYKTAPDKLDDNDLLKIFSHLIAYSQNANSKVVEQMLTKGCLDRALNNYVVEELIVLNPFDIIDRSWFSIKGIRQQTKIFHILSLARILRQNSSLYSKIEAIGIPKRIKTYNDINSFSGRIC